MRDHSSGSFTDGRRRFIRTGLGVAGGLALPAGFASKAWAEDRPPIGTWPAGSSGSSVFIGIAVPRTGTYAVQGEDELKGYELAVVHSHLSSEPRPSRTDVENVGLWRGRPYLIYSLRLDRLAGRGQLARRIHGADPGRVRGLQAGGGSAAPEPRLKYVAGVRLARARTAWAIPQ